MVNMESEFIFGIGARLKEERERLGYTMRGLANRLAITERTIVKYEADETAPNANILARFAALGADVLFIVTGQRSPSTAESLAPDEAALVENYRQTSPDRQVTLREVGAAFAECDCMKKAGS